MKNKIKKICCIGAGYVGGPSMAVIADRCPNLDIKVIDKNIERIAKWNSENLDELPIYEPGLKEVIKRVRNINLYFSTELEKNIAEADMIFISVNTPTKSRGIGAGKASDLKWIESCSRLIGEYSIGNTIIVEKSTLPVKTAETIKSILDSFCDKTKIDNNKVKRFSILSNPEFLAEGTAISDLENPDRVLIGGEDAKAINTLKEIYLNWIKDYKIITTDLWSSELSKLIANAFLAQRISSINSITPLCELTGANINDVAIAVGMDSRIGRYFLNSGPGFGGSCFKKDILNLVYICNYYGLSEVADYWEKVITINSWQQKRLTRIIVEKMFGTISEKKLAILGFAFKANTNDVRESPAITICKDLLEEGCYLNIFDPKVTELQIKEELGVNDNFGSLETNCGSWNFTSSINQAVDGADAIVILTDWSEFHNLNFEILKKTMRAPSWIFDTRNVVNFKTAKSYGFKVWKLGDGSMN